MIRLYDSASRTKREFEPGEPDRITLYVCGPTVYGRAHIGNARPPVVFDVLRRLLEQQYPERLVVFARNITDIDDKIIAAAKAEGVAPEVITRRFEDAYLEDMRALGVRDPDLAPHATAEIPAMIAMIAELIDRGHAYAVEGHVLFDVASDPEYGSLSRRDREAMLAGARVEVAPYKRAPGDFVLWKPSLPEVIGWDSPWGRGRPGWHIECSAMIRAHLGQTIDIHGGGIDLLFPHHENEAAQSRCAHDAPLARYWMHNGFVDFGSEKMSKSVGNVVLVNELLDQGHKGEVLRLALLSSHYRSPLPWTDGLIAQSRKSFERWSAQLSDFSDGEEEAAFVAEAGKPSEDFLKALCDDLNTPQAFAVQHVIVRQIALEDRPEVKRELLANLVGNAHLLGVTLSTSRIELIEDLTIDEHVAERVAERIAERTSAKQSRDFAAADRIRDELKAEGILLEDGPSGTTWRRA